jgi:hypothetical protein
MESHGVARRDKFQMSSGEVAFSRQLAASVGRAQALDDLRFDAFSSYWRDVLHVIPQPESVTTGETIAVIDSGFSPELTLPCLVDSDASVDLTGEGTLHDAFGHGTAIGSLIRLVAPSARQVHIRILNGAGTVAGANYADKIATVRRAFERAEAAGATIVNASWNYLTDLHEHEPDPRPDHFCHCPICGVIVDFVKRTNVDVFVSEGNYRYGSVDEPRPEGSWSCPAAAELAVPVIAYQDGRAVYNTNLDTSAGVPAPGRIGITPRGNAWAQLWWRFFPPSEQVITGSSFSAPLVAATFAALKMAFRERGFDVFGLPRSLDGPDGTGTTSFNFPMELFFVPPDDPNPHAQEFHEAWTVLAHNCKQRALKLSAAGHSARAGALCCLLADLMAVAYARLEKAPFEDGVANLIVEFYLSGISMLQRSGSPAIALSHLSRVVDVFALMKNRGKEIAQHEATLQQLAVNVTMQM